MNYSELEKHLENALNNCIEKECEEYFKMNKKYCGFTPTDRKPYSIKYNGNILRAETPTDLYNKLLSVWV